MKKVLFVILYSLTISALANAIDEKCPQHVLWGAPQVKQEGNNQYICRDGYAVNYNYATKVSYFSVEHITASHLIKTVPRKDDFREDPTIPSKYRATLNDYAGSGYDRGHMSPAGDFTYDAKLMDDSFYLSNMMPQVPGNNRGIWKSLEEMTRVWVEKKRELYIITGTVFTDKSPTIGNGVKVPTQMYKIIISPDKATTIAFLIPNVKIDPKNLEQYIVTIDEIQQKTGIDFNPAIPVQIQPIEHTRGSLSDW